ncbi:MAG: DUF309 domain-containing protein [Bacteroidetes bacterium]|nr:MAG: DUF309 domain-containing protein [Bacteroidota bacterium]
MIFSEQDTSDFNLGIKLFNEQQFWHAHEAWEAIWRRHPEEERVFLQGLIQLAAAYHHYISRRSFRGMVNNFKKAQSKLELFPAEYCGVKVAQLVDAINIVLELIERRGLKGFDELEAIEIVKIN